MLEVSVRTTTRVIVQYGIGIGERTGCEQWELDGADEQQFHTLISQPNGGITLSAEGVLAALPYVEPPPPVYSAREQTAIDRLKATFGTTRTAAQVNLCIDDLSVLLRRVWRELE